MAAVVGPGFRAARQRAEQQQQQHHELQSEPDLAQPANQLFGSHAADVWLLHTNLACIEENAEALTV